MDQSPAPPDWERLAGLLRRSFQRLTSDVLEDLRAVLNESLVVVRSSNAAVLVPDTSSNELRFLLSTHSKPGVDKIVMGRTVPCDRSLAGYVYLTGNLIARTNPAHADPEQFYRKIDQATGIETIHYLAAPILDEGQTLGVLTFVNRTPDCVDEPFGSDEIEWAQGIARLLLVGLRHYRRIAFQEAWLLAELERVTADLGSAGGPGGDRAGWESAAESTRPPLIRALDHFEELPAEPQALIADLIDCVARRLVSARKRDRD